MIPQAETGQGNGERAFDRFTATAKILLVNSQEEAWKLNHNYIGTEHLLLGAIAARDPKLAPLFEARRVTLSKAVSVVEFQIGRGDRLVVDEISLTPRAKRCIENAAEAAYKKGSKEIGSEHIIYGLLVNNEGIACGVLQVLGVNPEELKQAVEVLLKSTPSPNPSLPQP